MSQDILLSLIDTNPGQPRKFFDESGIRGLAQSIEENGLAVPICLRPAGGRYIIVHGERRFRAVSSLGWNTIPADVRELNAESASWLALIENIQRSDLSPIEEATAYRERLATGITQTELSKRIGKTQSYIAQKLRLLDAPDPIQYYIGVGAITESHARQLLKLRNIYTEDFRCELAPDVCEDILSGKSPLDKEGAFVFTNGIRPSYYPTGGLNPKSDAELATHRKGILAFLSYAKRHNYCPPAWACGATWWAMVAASREFSVAELERVIGFWTDRFYSAIARVKCWGRPRRNGENYILEWELSLLDLFHAGVDKDNISHDLLCEAIIFVGKKHSYALPSGMQPFGPYAEAGRRIIDDSRRMSANDLIVSQDINGAR